MIFAIAVAAASFCIVGQMGDAITTQLAFNKGYVEGNPIFAKFGIKTRGTLFAVKTALAILPAALALVLPGAGHLIGAAVCIAPGMLGIKQTVKNLHLL